MTADISPCGTYRYTLTRKVDCLIRSFRPILFIMLNPSTADATKDDPTIRRCISFARRQGCTHLTVVNLFALRATNPKELVRHQDPIGPFNDHRIAEELKRIHDSGGLVVAAWGANKFARDRAEEIKAKFGPLLCLGKTKHGSPKHPLYVKGDANLIDL